MISMFHLYKVGIGPSSSHTLGPMVAAKRFVDELHNQGLLGRTSALRIGVYGSLAQTGIGHKTDVALLLGLMGESPESVDIDSIDGRIQKLRNAQRLRLGVDGPEIAFPDTALTFHHSNLPRHENGLNMKAYAGECLLFEKNYYSIGGGFITGDDDSAAAEADAGAVPYPYVNARELLAHCRHTGLSLSGLVLENEQHWHSLEEIHAYFDNIWKRMRQSMQRGMKAEGVLPGPFRVPRRAAALHRRLASS